MKAKKLIELLSVLKPDSEVRIMDFREKLNGLEPLEYEIEVVEKTNSVYTNGYGVYECTKIYVSRKTKRDKV